MTRLGKLCGLWLLGWLTVVGMVFTSISDLVIFERDCLVVCSFVVLSFAELSVKEE